MRARPAEVLGVAPAHAPATAPVSSSSGAGHAAPVAKASVADPSGVAAQSSAGPSSVASGGTGGSTGAGAVPAAGIAAVASVPPPGALSGERETSLVDIDLQTPPPAAARAAGRGAVGPVEYTDRTPLSPDSVGSAGESEMTGGSRTDDGSEEDEEEDEEGSEESEGEGR